MATVQEVRDGLETRLATITGLRVRDHVPDQIEPPMAVVAYQGTDFHVAMANGLTAQRYFVDVLVGRQDTRTSQADVHEYVANTGTKSIRAAIEGDRTLGGLAHTDAVVDSVDSAGFEDIGGYTWLGVRFTVRVHTR